MNTLFSLRSYTPLDPYVIAEIGVNHGCDLDLAKKLIEQAAQGGAHAAKFQTYKAHLIASKNSPAYWDTTKEVTKNQFELFSKYDHFGEKEYYALYKHCQKIGIHFLSTPFDVDSLEWLNALVPFFKISSSDITNVDLLRKVAAYGKPVILSTGSSFIPEIKAAVKELTLNGCSEIAVLHCVLNYPTLNENAHLGMIDDLRQTFPSCIIGYSDHTLPDKRMSVLVSSCMRGATIIEKHFSHDKTLSGNDHYHAMDYYDLKIFFKELDFQKTITGTYKKNPLLSELKSRKHARRSLVLKKALRKGEVISKDHIISKRPGVGITSDNCDEIFKCFIRQDLPEDHVLIWQDLAYRGQNGAPKVIAVVQARMESTRFPRKMLEKLGGLTVYEWVIERLKKSALLDKLIIALPDTSENDVLDDIANKKGVSVVRGPMNDVLYRYILAARKFEADAIVRICADNPFVDPVEVDRLIAYYNEHQPDYAFNHLDKFNNGYPNGLGAEIVSRSTLECIHVEAVSSSEREHIFNYIWSHQENFNIQTFRAPESIAYPALKLDIDMPIDLEFHQKKLSHFDSQDIINISSLDLVTLYNKDLRPVL